MSVAGLLVLKLLVNLRKTPMPTETFKFERPFHVHSLESLLVLTLLFWE